jgi:hypothetical protein
LLAKQPQGGVHLHSALFALPLAALQRLAQEVRVLVATSTHRVVLAQVAAAVVVLEVCGATVAVPGLAVKQVGVVQAVVVHKRAPIRVAPA